MLLNGSKRCAGAVDLIELGVVVVVGEVAGDDLIDLWILKDAGQRRVVQVPAFDVVVAVDHHRFEVRNSGYAGEKGVHERVQARIIDRLQDLVHLEVAAFPFRYVGCENVPANAGERLGEYLAATWIVQQQRLAAVVLVDGEQMGAARQQRWPQAEEVREYVEDVGHAEPHRARQHRRQLFRAGIPEQVIDGDVVTGAGGCDVHDRNVVLLSQTSAPAV